ncbi:MAG TPA: endonuclease/exonuclease/phosphatase family protein [Flavobacteriaceae bacterium]|nr:endonuclease/exonuclease/phosphatase family protein [Flavobacteriaceae bacterium]
MKQLRRLLDRAIFILNALAATMLLLSYILPYVQPQKFPTLSVLSLAVPFLIVLNLLFMIYWLLQVKKKLILSLSVLLIGFIFLSPLYKFSSSKHVDDAENMSVMNYNVRLFNLFEWIPDTDVKQKIANFIDEKQPDVMCMQEYRPDDVLLLKGYYKYEELSGDKLKNGQAIFSKFPIVNSGSIKFPHTFNNAIYADIIKGRDTIRIYNVHLQSLRINPTDEKLNIESSENLVNRVGTTFKLQQSQAELFLAHKAKCPYKMIICGDFNNTAYSFVYKEIKGDLLDAFVEAGNGFGRTFNFKFFPVRIDFILADNSFDINGFKTFDVELSDHYPIMAKLKLK